MRTQTSVWGSHRIVSRKEYLSNPEAMDAYWKEWKNLEEKEVWKWNTLAEFDDVKDEVIRQGGEAHFGYLLGIMVEKGAEFPEGDKRRYFKYRVVFQENNVRDQN